MDNKNFTETFKLKNISIDYKVNEEKGIVVAIEKFSTSRIISSYSFKTVGVAKLNKEAGEIFDINVGKKIARAKAEKEAFIKFKLLVLKFKKFLDKEVAKTDNTLSKMDTNILHQKEYIKSF